MFCSGLQMRCKTLASDSMAWDAACGGLLHPACSRLSLAFDVISCKQNAWLINLADTPKQCELWVVQKLPMVIFQT